jgi:FkbM family methyltransferase
LKRNTWIYGNIRPFHKALGDKEVLVTPKADDTRVGNTGANFVEIDPEGSVEMVTIDSMHLKELDFLKLDLEGAEYLALKGAEETLRRCRPVVFVEVKKGMAERFGLEKDAPLRFLESLGAKQVTRLKNDYVYSFDE